VPVGNNAVSFKAAKQQLETLQNSKNRTLTEEVRLSELLTGLRDARDAGTHAARDAGTHAASRSSGRARRLPR
jgi:hypothetical protein